jgi:putative membrane protein insertion efficiency factor
MQRALTLPRVIAIGFSRKARKTDRRAIVSLFRFSARTAAFALLRAYKLVLSPLLPSACRFHPTCSDYMKEAIEKHGVVKGVGLGLRRLSRCHPFHQGGFDPVR